MNDTRKIIEAAVTAKPSMREASAEWVDALQALQLAKREAMEAMEMDGLDPSDAKLKKMISSLEYAESVMSGHVANSVLPASAG